MTDHDQDRDLDRLLSDAGVRWRSTQTPPPSPDPARLQPRSRPSPLRALVTAAVTVAIVGAVVVGGSHLLPADAVPAGPPSATPTQQAVGPAQPVASASATPSAAPPSMFPGEVLGLPTHTVSQAIDLIASGSVDGRAIAVAGYWDPGPLLSCPARPGTYITTLQGYCNGAVLTETEQHLRYSKSDSLGGEYGTLPRTGPLLDTHVLETPIWSVLEHAADAAPSVPGPDPGEQLMTEVPVVLVGHTGDPRIWACPVGAVRSTCRTTFVIDRVAWLDGQALGVQLEEAQGRQLTSADVEEQVAALLPDSGHVLSIQSADPTDADDIEPRLAPDPDHAVWITRSIAGDVDANGTSPIQEIIIDDHDGSVVTQQPLASAPGYAPALLILQYTSLDLTGKADPPYFEVDNASGALVHAGYLGKTVVLDAGHYTLKAWLAKTDHSVPVGDPHDGCTVALDLTAGAQVVERATSPATGPCEWAPSDLTTP